MRNTAVVLVLAGAVLLGGCRSEPEIEDQVTGTMTPEDVRQARANWPAGVPELIDSANAAYSAKDYESANSLYREAARRAPDITAGWFGVWMAEQARGNIAAADSAMQRAQSLAPGASLMHVAPGDTQTRSPH